MEPRAGEPGRQPGGSAHHRGLPGPAGQRARPAGAELREHAPAGGAEAGPAAADRAHLMTRAPLGAMVKHHAHLSEAHTAGVVARMNAAMFS